MPIGKQYISPNKDYSVAQSELSNGDRRFLIKDLQTQKVDSSVNIDTIANYIFWNDDSQSFIGVMHIAQGSFATIVYRKNGKWTSTDYEPPYLGNTKKNIFQYNNITKLILMPNEVHIIYYVGFGPGVDDNTEMPDSKIYDIEVSLKTFKVINTKIMPTKE